MWRLKAGRSTLWHPRLRFVLGYARRARGRR